MWQVSIPRSGFCLFIRARRSILTNCLESFNPSVGILFVHTGHHPAQHTRAECFNPSVGILFVHTPIQPTPARRPGSFQSLGRDSVCSYITESSRMMAQWVVSIPRSGFCLFILFAISLALKYWSFQSLGRDSVCSYYDSFPDVHDTGHVSIPRSGFCLFIPTGTATSDSIVAGFNPSVGILFVHTCAQSQCSRRLARVSIPRSGFCLFIQAPGRPMGHCAPQFQSLGRDSVCSYFDGACFSEAWRLVSIPRSGFCLFILARLNISWMRTALFQSLGRDSVCSYSLLSLYLVLLSKFQSLGRDSVCSYADWLVTPELLERFQSLGRDSVCSYVGKATLDDRLVVFQSLGRDSVCSYWRRCRGMCRRIAVSIPRSGFCLFIRDVQAEDDWGVSSFNPSVGILFVHTRGNRSPPPAGRPFQSLGRDSVCSYLKQYV